jgi:Xaa-Pro aminopeptidase
MTEKQVAWAMESAMREAGADGLSFPVIVAGGPNSALPHAVPSERPLRTGEPILFDWGAKLNGYCSDTSRTIILGAADDTFKKVHGTVLEAQQRAIAAIRAGINSKMVDAAARDFIHQSGYEGKFGHGLGHGTGLAVHEAPRLSPLRETILESGMLVTVEPGIYLPEWGACASRTRSWSATMAPSCSIRCPHTTAQPTERHSPFEGPLYPPISVPSDIAGYNSNPDNRIHG